MSRRLWLPLLFALLSLILVAALPEPEPSPISAGAPRRLVPTFTPTAYLSPLPTPTPLLPPRLVAHEPDEQLLRVRRPTFSLTFDRPMDQASIAAALQITPTVPVDLRWKANNLHIVPRQPLMLGADYHLIIAATAQDGAGVPLGANAIRFDYTVATSALASLTGPTSANPQTPIEFYFNFSLDPQIAQQAVGFEPALTGKWQWNENHTFATFTPATRLLSDANYTVRFQDALVDANGDPLSAPAPQHFTTPPPILPTNALDTAYMNPLNDVTLTFDRPMDEASVAAAFQIDPPITGTLTWQGTMLSFHPTRGYFAENTSYTVTIAPGIRSAQGEVALQHPYLLNFHTSNIVKQVSFGWGPNAQVVDVAGRRALQILLSNSDAHQDAHPLYFSLYRLTFEQFLAQYASGFRGVAGNEKQTLDPSGAELVKSWTLPPEDHTDQPTNPSVREVILPEDVPPGLYILNMGPPVLGDQLIVLLTRHVITLKQAEGQLIAWVTDINDGPVQNSAVSLYARDGLLLGQGRTDNQGLWRTQVAADPQPLLAVARDGDDVTATGFSNEWRSRNGQWWGWWQPAPKAEQYTAYVYTDRPIYRPGQTVFFKAILRNDDDAALSLPPGGTPVTVRIRDGRDNVVQTLKLVTNAFGTVNGQFALAAGAMLGEYAVELNVANENHRQIFKVQEYHKPDYAVTVATNATQYVVSDTILITATARYFFGEPVANANLTLKKFMLQPLDWWMTQPNQRQPQFAWYDFFPEPLTAKTDANGVFTVTWPAQFTNMQQPWAWDWQSSLQQSTWGIEVTVDDGSHQTVSNFATVKVFNAAEGLHLDTGGYVKDPRTPFTVTVAARTVAGEPVAARSLQLVVERYRWDNGQQQVTTSLYTVTTATNGQATQSLTLDPGYYHLVIKGQDPAGHGLKYESWVYVFNQADQWDWRGEGNLSIKADRDTYAPGDQARLVIESTFSGPALITFERGKTRREQLIELKAPLTVLTTPIQPDDAPNIFVTVNAWQPQDTTLKSSYVATNLPDSRLQTASVALHVPVQDKTLQVTLTPDRTAYAPRDAVTVTVQVRNYQGAPVTAELSLALVDEAIFSLSDELAGPIFDAFYHERLNLVRTYDSMALTRYIGGMGGGGGGGLLANPRSNFPDTAVWLPVVHTGADGKATVTLTLPDTLTSWRLTAKAVTGEKTEVGETKINLVTHQPLILQPSLPHTLVTGDQTELTTMVHNYSDQPQLLQVWVQTNPTQLAVHGPLTQTVRLAPGEKQVVGWVATALSAGDAPITIRTKSAEADPLVGDAVRLTLPIQPLAIPDVTTQVGEFTGSLTTEVQLPANALALSSVKLELSRSIAGTLLTGLEYLTGYPYGCVEQTMSRALPNAVVGRAFRQLGVGNPTLQADLPPLINAGLQRLYGYQHNDGGWGWWYDDSTDAYQTAWVIFGLSVTREAGYEVDPGVIERGATWLATPKTLDAMDIRTRAFALFSLANAGYGDLPATRALLQEVDKLDTFSQAALALAFHSLGINDKAEQLAEKLAKTAKVEDGKAYWPSATEDGHYYQKTMSSTTRSTALALAAFVHIQPHHELEPDIVRWLMSQRRQEGWGSTNETSFTLWALTDYLLQQRETTADTTYRVELNGQELTHGRLGRGEPAVTLEIAADQMRRGANALRIEQNGGGQLYYVINSRTYQAEPTISAAGNIKLERQYLDITTKQPLTHAVVGQLVQVQLNVQMPDNGFYMLVEDALPGGLEALNESLNTSSHQAVANQEPLYYWQQYGYNEKEVHDDRVTFFITELNAGQRTFTYLARVIRVGEFVAMPVQAYAMYDATKWGRSASQTFVVDAAATAVQLPASLYFLGEDAQIWRLAQDGQTKTKVTSEAAGITAFDVSPVHRRLVYVTADEQHLIEFDPVTKQRVVKVTGLDRHALPDDQHEDAKMRAPHYSPDGQQISFAYRGINLIASGLTTDAQPQLLRPNLQVDTKTGDVEKIRLYREAMWSSGGAYLAFYFNGWESTGYELYHLPTKNLTPLIHPGYNIPTGFDQWYWGRDEQTAYIASTSMVGPGPGFFRLDLPQGLLTPIHTEIARTQEAIFPAGLFAQGVHETATGKLYAFLNAEGTVTQPLGDVYQLYALAPDAAPPTRLNRISIKHVREILWAADSSGALVVTERPTQEPPYPVETVEWIATTDSRVEKLPIRGTQLHWGQQIVAAR